MGSYQKLGILAADPDIIKIYGERNVKTSCQYFVQYVTETSNILDVGCGPGGITADLAKIAAKGQTVGVDNSEGVIELAKAAFSDVPNLKFQVGDATDLKDFADNSFDIIHSHQMLIHCSSPAPVKILKEFYRICKPGGFIAVRDTSRTIVLSLKPDLPGIREYWANSLAFIPTFGGQTQAGRDSEGWAKEAGWGADGGKIIATKSGIGNPGHLSRCTGKALEDGVKWKLATREQLEKWADDWREWEATEGHEWIMEAGEIVCWKAK
jgi:ubiquinone/menaquinone biosynthesis C-methylase UbiE